MTWIMGDFKCLTFNVKGIQNKVKRTQIFNYCKEKINGNGIVLLQETHSCGKNLARWKNEWGTDIYLNHGSSNSRGTLIAFTKNFEKKVLRYVDDKNGRIQILTFEHKKKKFMIINVYNNNIEREQVETLKKIDTLMGSFDDINEYSIIAGGDWNFILDKKLDAYGGSPKLKLHSIAEHTKLKNKFLLCDIYRIRNQNLKRFTFRQKTPCLARRLDRFMISKILQARVTSCEILPSLLSDHSPICITINTENVFFKKGKSYWKFNSLLLKDNNYTTGLKKMIAEKKVEYADLNNQIKWELIKYEIRKFTMMYSKKVAREKRRLLEKNEKITIEFESKPRDEHSISEVEYNRAKQGIELYHMEKAKGYILRSKCEIYEEGEKSTKFFLGLEKKRAINGTIDSLQVEGNKEVQNYTEVLEEIKKFYKKLFMKQDLNKSDTQIFLEGLNLPKISESEQLLCETEITLDDLKESMLSMCDDKSPGNDGITRELYNFFWEDVGMLMYDSFMEAKVKKELSVSQRQAIIKLLEKMDKDRRFLKNWRPISLLNIDVKILNKALANKLKKVLKTIVGANQTAYVMWRVDLLERLLD